VFSRGTGKKDSVMVDLKADAFIDSTNAEEMKVDRLLLQTALHPYGA